MLDANTLVAGNQAFVLVAEDFTGTPGGYRRDQRRVLVQLDVDVDGMSDFALTVISATDRVAPAPGAALGALP